MKEKFPAKEGRSKSYSKHEEWEEGGEITEFILLPLFVLSFLLDDLF